MAINCVSSPSEIEASNQITNKTQAQAQQMLNLNIYMYMQYTRCVPLAVRLKMASEYNFCVEDIGEIMLSVFTIYMIRFS